MGDCKQTENTETRNLNQNKIMSNSGGDYFLQLLKKEKSRILKLADDAEQELQTFAEQIQADETDSGSEDTLGLIRAAIGKARLLANQKFKQFEGLCEENIKVDHEGPKILSDDLQGFWDMMMIQVESIDEAFKELQSYRENGWKKPEENQENFEPEIRTSKRPLSNKAKSLNSVPPKKPANPEAAQKRAEQRKILLEMKKKYKSSMEEKSDVSENFLINCD